MNKSNVLKKIQNNFNEIEKIIENYTVFNKDERCVVDISHIESKDMFYLTAHWNEVKISSLRRKVYSQHLYIFFNETNKSFVIDTRDVKFQNSKDEVSFKNEVKKEIDSIISKEEEKEN